MKSKNTLGVILPIFLFFSTLLVFAASLVTFEILAAFDYPGAVFTSAAGINDHGDVAGIYSDASGIFVRWPTTEPLVRLVRTLSASR